MAWSVEETLPRIRVILKKYPEWHLASRTRCYCRMDRCTSLKRFDRSRSLITKWALEKYFTRARVSVRQKHLRGRVWLFARVANPGQSGENSVMRRDARELLTNLGVRYPSYDGRVGKRLYIRLAVNDGPFRRL